MRSGHRQIYLLNRLIEFLLLPAKLYFIETYSFCRNKLISKSNWKITSEYSVRFHPICHQFLKPLDFAFIAFRIWTGLIFKWRKFGPQIYPEFMNKKHNKLLTIITIAWYKILDWGHHHHSKTVLVIVAYEMSLVGHISYMLLWVTNPHLPF